MTNFPPKPCSIFFSSYSLSLILSSLFRQLPSYSSTFSEFSLIFFTCLSTNNYTFHSPIKKLSIYQLRKNRPLELTQKDGSFDSAESSTVFVNLVTLTLHPDILDQISGLTLLHFFQIAQASNYHLAE